MPHPLKPPDRRSVAAKRQARYRARHKEEKIYPKRRCLNCPRFFIQNPRSKKFCCEQCRKQFHEYGSAYGSIKEHLETKLIPRLVREQTHAAIVLTIENLARIETTLREQQRALDLIVATMAHKHEPLKELRDKIRELDARVSVLRNS